MTRRDFLASPAVGGAALQGKRSRPRNIVFILADDHRHDFGGAWGHPWLRTPNLDRLTRGGTRFRNAFVTTSLCSPSRASILTGLYMHAHRVMDNFTELDASLPTFPKLLQAAGYRTGYAGKWHMGGASDEKRPGFDHWVSFFGQGQYFDPEINVNGVRRKQSGYITDILTGHSLDFIRENRDRPFLLYLSHKAVHFEFKPAGRHASMYASEPVPRPYTMPWREEEGQRKPEWVRRRRFSRQGVDGMYDHVTTFDEAYRNYCRSLMAIDDSVGAVLDELQKSGVADNTLVVYMGDNGFMWGEQGLIDKRAMYEPSIRVPLVLHAPGLVRTGATEDGLALNLDIAPTLLEAAGVRAPGGMHGQSLLRPPEREEFLYEYEWEFDYPYTPTLTGLRTKQHSYCQSYGLWDLDELYDVVKDPEQRNNLLGEVKIRRQRARLTEQIADKELKVLVELLQEQMKKLLSATGGDPRRSGRSPEGLRNAL